MAKKFIPNSDSQFANMARSFAQKLAQDWEKLGVPEAQSRAIGEAVTAFRAAMVANYPRHTRSMQTVERKDQTRAVAEKLIRHAGHLVRSNPKLGRVDKMLAGIRPRAERPAKAARPDTAPSLYLKTTTDRTFDAAGIHTIKFSDHSPTRSRGKPEGTARLELFFEVVPYSQPCPRFPGVRDEAPMGYLRSYTRSPIKVKVPSSNEPAYIVYWARWANPTGETGPFSRPVVAPMQGEGWSTRALPAPTRLALEDEGPLEQTVIITSARRELPDCVETIDTLRAQSKRMLPEKTSEAA